MRVNEVEVTLANQVAEPDERPQISIKAQRQFKNGSSDLPHFRCKGAAAPQICDGYFHAFFALMTHEIGHVILRPSAIECGDDVQDSRRRFHAVASVGSSSSPTETQPDSTARWRA